METTGGRRIELESLILDDLLGEVVVLASQDDLVALRGLIEAMVGLPAMTNDQVVAVAESLELTTGAERAN